MTPRRRRWLTALGLFLATAVGGAIAYLLRRRRLPKGPAPEQQAVSELSARLRREAAAQEERLRRRPGALRRLGQRLGRRAGRGIVLPAPPPAAGGGQDEAASVEPAAPGDTGGLRDEAGSGDAPTIF